MTQKQKGYVGLGVMLALGVGTVFGSDSLYKAIDVMSREKVDYTPGTYVGSAQGFGGEVVATVTVGAAGIESVDLAGAGETPGIGAAALEQLPAAFVESNSSVVDAVAGATISSQAAMDAVQQALDQASGKIDVIEREAAPEAETEAEKKEPAADVNYAPGTYEGSAKGFGGDVTATVVIGDAGIESVELKGDGETPELGGEALKKLGPAFVEAGSADVDAVAGCTVSSQAAMKAVQAALDQAAGGEAADEKKDDADAGKSSAPVSLKPGTYEGSAKGFGGDVTATVVVGDKGIESVELKGDGETPELGGEALKKLGPAFVEAGSADVDGVAGCTVTSEAAKKAVAAALEGAEGGEAAQASAQSDSGSLKAGTYEGSAKGFGGDVTATVVVGDKGIESVELKGDGETPELGGEAIKKLGPAFVEAGSADVDGVAGCTVTSEAAKKAVAAALESAKGGDGAQAGAQSDSASFKPGTYEGSAKGFGGDVTATVVVGDTGIESVELNGSGETPELGGEALKKLGPAFAEAGSADVDGVAGCTVTSEAAKKAVQAALDQAK